MKADSGLRGLVEKWRGPIAPCATGTEWNGRKAQAQACADELESILTAAGESQDRPIDAEDNAGYIEHCADILGKHGYRITATTLRAVATVHRELASQPTAPAGMVLVPRHTRSEVIGAMQHAHSIYAPGSKMERAYAAMCEYFSAAPAAQVAVVQRRSTHHVHRGPESLPCYCAATCDHAIGDESGAAPAVVVDEGYSADRIFHPGDRVIWQSSNGTEFPAKIVKVNHRVTTYDAKLDDGCDANDFAAGRFRPAIAAALSQGHSHD